MRSRKNETDTHDFEVEKLEKPDDGQSLEFLESKAVGIRLEKKTPIPPEVRALYRLYKTGALKGVPLSLPGVHIPDLEVALRYYFKKRRATSAELSDLIEIARHVSEKVVN